MTHSYAINLDLKDVKAFILSLYRLTKPTIGFLVVFTAIPALLGAQASFPSVFLMSSTLLGIWLSSASAAVFNQVIDARIDLEMERTKKRPLPLGNVSTNTAIVFGFLLGILGTGLLCATSNPLSAGIALGANVFYVLIYTLILKHMTVQNIVIGGAAGAVGPLIGWAAVTGTLSYEAWIMFLVIFLWTPPHFWALSLKYKDDYARAGVPMLPVVRGLRVTQNAIFYYSLTLLPIFIPLSFLGYSSWVATILATGLSAVFVLKAWELKQQFDIRTAMGVFGFSCLYLLVVFAVLSIDQIIHRII